MNYIAYYRVSTKMQGNSGLGLDAQRKTVQSFLKNNDSLLQEFTEIDSGKNDKRIELLKAIHEAKNLNAKLLIAKLDRLSRNAGFIFLLKDSGVDFICCDMPELNTLTLGIFATLAQYERELISERTKKALQAKKLQGFKLGKPENLKQNARDNSIQARRKNAIENENNKKAYSLAIALKNSGASLNKIAKSLNQNGFKTRRGKNFTAKGVSNLIALFEKN